MPDPPRRGRRFRRESLAGGNAKRIALAVFALVLIGLALSLRSIATFWTHFLWFDNLGLNSV